MNKIKGAYKSKIYIILFLESTVFCDITPCSPLKFNQYFGGTYHLHLHGRRISRARNQRESRWQAETIVPFITTAVRTSNPTILFLIA
jgi:hypothetical protein